MPSSYSPLLRLELPATGEQSNTWGDTVNRNLGTLLEKSIAGAISIDVTASDVTLSQANGADDQARCAIILVSGLPGATRNIVVPATSKTYVIYNGSNAAAIVKAPATAGATINAGEYVFLVWNGLDFVRVGVSPISPSFTGTPTVPTAPVDTNTLQIANTAFVIAQGYLKATTASLTYAPLNGVGTSGTWPITAANSQLLDGIDSTGFMQLSSLGTIALANIDNDRPSGLYVVQHSGFSSTLLDWGNLPAGNSAPRFQMQFMYSDDVYFRVARDTTTNWDGVPWNNNRLVHTGWFNPVGGSGASGTWNIDISGNSASTSFVAWTNVSGRPTALSQFTNDAGYITAASPALTGTPTAPTQSVSTNNTSIATTAYVHNYMPVTYGSNLANVSRFLDTTYTNNTGRPLIVSGSAATQTTGQLVVVINGVNIWQHGGINTPQQIGFFFIVPISATYKLLQSTNTSALTYWYEA